MLSDIKTGVWRASRATTRGSRLFEQASCSCGTVLLMYLKCHVLRRYIYGVVRGVFRQSKTVFMNHNLRINYSVELRTVVYACTRLGSPRDKLSVGLALAA